MKHRQQNKKKKKKISAVKTCKQIKKTILGSQVSAINVQKLSPRQLTVFKKKYTICSKVSKCDYKKYEMYKKLGDFCLEKKATARGN